MAVAEVEVGFRAPQVKNIVGISYRQLDYWDRTNLVTPSVREAGGSGTQRLYSFENVLMLRVIKKLLEAGVALQQIRKAVTYLKTKPSLLSSVTLMSDGNRIYLPESPDAVLDLLSKGQAIFAINVGKVAEDLDAAMRKAKKR